MLLNEILTSPVKWRKISGEEYQFTVDDDKYQAYMSPVNLKELLDYMESGEYDQEIRGVFNRLPKRIKSRLVNVSFIKKKTGDDFKISTTYEISKSSKPLVVFSTVIDIIKNYVEDHPMFDGILFSAKEPSRKKLYQHLVQKYSKEFNKRYETFEHDDDDYYIIIL